MINIVSDIIWLHLAVCFYLVRYANRSKYCIFEIQIFTPPHHRTTKQSVRCKFNSRTYCCMMILLSRVQSWNHLVLFLPFALYCYIIICNRQKCYASQRHIYLVGYICIILWTSQYMAWSGGGVEKVVFSFSIFTLVMLRSPFLTKGKDCFSRELSYCDPQHSCCSWLALFLELKWNYAYPQTGSIFN